jgi:hypothetical protein
MTDMTLTKTQTAAEAVPPKAPDAKAAPAARPALITLEQLAKEMKLSARDARMLLRLAAKQKALYPALGKEHVARQPWMWEPGSKALAEARKALDAGQS